MSTTYAIRVDETVKDEAAKVAQFYGLDLASATRALWYQMARTKRIPLEFSNEEPNEESLESIREVQEMIASGKGARFKTAREMLDAILGDEEC